MESTPVSSPTSRGDGRADIVGFGDAGVWTALSNGDGTFSSAVRAGRLRLQAGGWEVEKHPRFLADISGEGRADIVGFGDAGVYVALANADGAFPGPVRFVLPNFGYQLTVLAIAGPKDRESTTQASGVPVMAEGRGRTSMPSRVGRPPPRRWPARLGAGHCTFVYAAGAELASCQPRRGAT